MKIQEYLDKTNNSVTSLAASCGFNFFKIYRILKGHVPTLSTALKIEKETGGMVKPQDMLDEKTFEQVYGKN